MSLLTQVWFYKSVMLHIFSQTCCATSQEHQQQNAQPILRLGVSHGIWGLYRTSLGPEAFSSLKLTEFSVGATVGPRRRSEANSEACDASALSNHASPSASSTSHLSTNDTRTHWEYRVASSAPSAGSQLYHHNDSENVSGFAMSWCFFHLLLVDNK